jgi:general secretion pathway protein J
MRNGFTLMELLVALVVFGLLMVGLTRGIETGFKTWERQADSVGQTSELDAVDRALRGMLGHLDAGGGVVLAQIAGDSSHFEFTSDLPHAAALADRHADMNLLLSGDKLILRWSPHRHEQVIGAGLGLHPPGYHDPNAHDEVLLRGVAAIELAYWHKPDAVGQGAGWRADWSEHFPPELIRLRIRFAKTDHRHWPDLVVALVPEPGG